MKAESHAMQSGHHAAFSAEVTELLAQGYRDQEAAKAVALRRLGVPLPWQDVPGGDTSPG